MRLLLFIFISFCTFGQADTITFEPIPQKKLQHDFLRWKKRIEKHQPLAYLYDSKDSFQRYFDSVYALIDRPMTEIEFYKIIGPTNAFVKDGHTQIRPSKKLQSYIVKHSNRLPLPIIQLYDSFYVFTDPVKSDLIVPGARILSINGVPISRLYDEALSLLSDDGRSRAYAEHWVNRSFWYYYHLLYGFNETYLFDYIDEYGNSRKAGVDGISPSEYNKAISRFNIGRPSRKPTIQFTLNPPNEIGILKIGAFHNSTIRKQQSTSPKKLIISAFDSIQKSNIQTLIIDIRGNGGGEPENARRVLEYLIDHPFEFKRDVRLMKNRNKEALNKRTRSRLFKNGVRGTFKPNEYTFSGKVIVIMDGGATSASADFVGVLDKYNRATFAGSECGGNPVVFTGWLFRLFQNGHSGKLKHSKCKFAVGNKVTLLQDIEKNTGRGLLPDFTINPTFDEYIQSGDFILNETIKLAESKGL